MSEKSDTYSGIANQNGTHPTSPEFAGRSGVREIDNLDLSHFCYTEDDRPYLMKPWSRGGFTYATDGVALVRVPRRAYVADNVDAPDVEGRILSKLSFDDLRPVAIPKLPPLRFFMIESDELLSPDFCALNIEHARFAGARLNLRYVHLLCWLPDLRVGPAADERSPTPFGFAGGGIGCVMPTMRSSGKPPEYDFGDLPEPAALSRAGGEHG